MEKQKRNPVNMLKLSLKFAKEYFKTLCEMQKFYSAIEIEKSKELTLIQRALWTSLIIEVGRFFDTYKSKSKKVISFKQLDYLSEDVNKIFGEKIIQRIITTRHTFTAHFGEERNDTISAPEICNSNLEDLLDKLSKLQIKSNRIKP